MTASSTSAARLKRRNRSREAADRRAPAAVGSATPPTAPASRISRTTCNGRRRTRRNARKPIALTRPDSTQPGLGPQGWWPYLDGGGRTTLRRSARQPQREIDPGGDEPLLVDVVGRPVAEPRLLPVVA